MARVMKSPEIRRQEILDTALMVFCEKGYEKTSVADIAKRLGIAQGLCYRYFPSKEAILDCAIDRYAQYQVSQMASVLCDETRTLGQKLAEFPAFFEYEDTGDGYFALCHGEGSGKIHEQLSLRICALMVPLVKKQLDAANRRGEIAVEDPETAASFFVYGQLGILNKTDLPGKERVERIRVFLYQLLGLNPV